MGVGALPAAVTAEVDASLDRGVASATRTSVDDCRRTSSRPGPSEASAPLDAAAEPGRASVGGTSATPVAARVATAAGALAPGPAAGGVATPASGPDPPACGTAMPP